ncbi:MAG: pimeloyl-ACP methyl ester carboxylesterase [Bacteroidia bacterium]|jgi:pimeloyl-ACP methyl ester carboxylesterase
MTFTEKQIVILGNEINYVEAGQGQPMLFLHNGGGFWQSWIKQIEHYASKYHVFGIDWPGFGNSAEINEPFTMDLLTNTLIGFIERFNLKNVNLVGNCIGGSAALMYSLQNRNNVKALIIFNVCPGKDIYRKPFYSYLIRKINSNHLLKKGVAKILGFVFTKTFVRKQFPAVLFSDEIDESDFLYQKYVEKFKEDQQTRARIKMVFGVHTFTLKDVLDANVQIDHTLIWGSKNRVTPLLTHGYFHKALLKSTNFEIMEGGSHLCMYEQPEKTIQIINKVLLEI